MAYPGWFRELVPAPSATANLPRVRSSAIRRSPAPILTPITFL